MKTVQEKNRKSKRESRFNPRSIAELREEIEGLVDYLDLLEARAQNFAKRRHSTEQVKKILKLG